MVETKQGEVLVLEGDVHRRVPGQSEMLVEGVGVVGVRRRPRDEGGGGCGVGLLGKGQRNGSFIVIDHFFFLALFPVFFLHFHLSLCFSPVSSYSLFLFFTFPLLIAGSELVAGERCERASRLFLSPTNIGRCCILRISC